MSQNGQTTHFKNFCLTIIGRYELKVNAISVSQFLSENVLNQYKILLIESG